jgi:predicted permease
LVGGALGLVLATFLLSFVRALAPLVLPAYADVSLDARGIIVTMLAALCTGLVFGTAPAFAVEHVEAHGVLRDETRGASEGRRSRRLRGVLAAGQVALCVSLLAGAGLLIRSLWQMTTAPLGFDSARVLTAAIRLPAYDYRTPQARIQFLERFVDRLRGLPGVEAAAAATSVPTEVRNSSGFAIEGVAPKEVQPFVLVAVVSDDYFRALRIPLQQGRTFDARDRLDAPPAVVISESMARRYWPAGDAIGARIRMGPDQTSPLATVVGIVGDVRNDPARQDAEPMAYRSSRQASSALARVLLRTQGNPLALVKPVERELAALNRGVPLEQPMTLDSEVGEGFAARRLPVMLIAAFAGLALLLASVGVYALFSSMGIARQQEFGIRIALGSRPRAIAGLMLRQGAGWMAGGLTGGALGIVLVGRVLRGLLYDVAPFDPIALASSIAIVVGCAAIALLIPVRHATRVDPIAMLRGD